MIIMIYGAIVGRARQLLYHPFRLRSFLFFSPFSPSPFSSLFLRDEDGKRRWEESALYHALLFLSSPSPSSSLSVFIILSASSYPYHLAGQSWTARASRATRIARMMRGCRICARPPWRVAVSLEEWHLVSGEEGQTVHEKEGDSSYYYRC